MTTGHGKGQLAAKRVRVVLYEGNGATPLPAEDRKAALVGLLEDGHAVTRTAVRANGGSNGVAAADDSEHVVLGRFAELPAQSNGTSYVDIADQDAQAIRDSVKARVEQSDAVTNETWKPWFPVIDYDRCTNCMQCLTFCLFDVYGVDDQKQIQVQTQDNCKTDCPACSRVCPEAAILFPKYKAGPINGDVVKDEDLQRESMKVDISALLGGDIYKTLRERSTSARKRFSTERDESKALLERKRCLKKLQKDLDIPNEVLMTLPSAGDIEERARRAQEKAERRKQRSQSMKDREAERRPTTSDDWGI